jgi:hypothetical protein
VITAVEGGFGLFIFTGDFRNFSVGNSLSTVSSRRDPAMTPITKHVERSTATILSKTAAHQTRKTVVALAHVAALHQQKDPQAPAEADHRFALSPPSNSAAKVTSPALLI